VEKQFMAKKRAEWEQLGVGRTMARGLGDLSEGAGARPPGEIHLLCKLHFRFRLAQLAARLKTN